MKCEAAVAIQASAGLVLVSVSRQHARSSLVRNLLFVCLFMFPSSTVRFVHPLDYHCIEYICHLVHILIYKRIMVD